MDQDLEIEKEINAMMIQKVWRLRKHIKAARQVVPSLREKFHFYYSSISFNMKATTSTQRLFTFVKNKKLQYFAFNLCDNPMCQQWVKQQRLNQDPLPFIFINKVYIGSMDELQMLIDFKLFDPIMNQEYLKHCLACMTPRESLENEKCQNCQTNYIFFQKIGQGVKICPKCREQQDEDKTICEKCQMDCIRVNKIFIHLKEVQ
ncbi:unnamed protein product [Paramecium primaurelia]|uniref:Glutaredoxin domain-containing protein n=2 Tax=Paramecium TaxID=5884 RepID=A0A8S1XMY7_9CILI|nr:unnamed protein product [Paramecium primaurelia]CAD8202429.1 unnamed protein product [Paramecium pentaurelia]